MQVDAGPDWNERPSRVCSHATASNWSHINRAMCVYVCVMCVLQGGAQTPGWGTGE